MNFSYITYKSKTNCKVNLVKKNNKQIYYILSGKASLYIRGEPKLICFAVLNSHTYTFIFTIVTSVTNLAASNRKIGKYTIFLVFMTHISFQAFAFTVVPQFQCTVQSSS